VTQTIAPAPTQVPSTCVRKQEPSGSETQSSDSESSLYADYKEESIMNIDAGGKRGTSGLEGGEILVDGQQMQVDDVQLSDGEMGRVAYDAMGEGVGDGDEGDYGDDDCGMGYDVPVLPSFSGGGVRANWPGDVVMTNIWVTHLLWAKILILEPCGNHSLMVMPTIVLQQMWSCHCHTFKFLGILVFAGVKSIIQFPWIQMQL